MLERKGDATANDVRKLKAVLIKMTNSLGMDQLFHMEKFSSNTDFEDFCKKLDDETFRELFVRCNLSINLHWSSYSCKT